MKSVEKHGMPPNTLDNTTKNNKSTALTKQILSTRNENGRKGKQMHDRYRKAPEAPKRFKSSYIFFFIENQGKVKKALGSNATISEISKRTSELWRNLSIEQRAPWEEKSLNDKERFEAEKSIYTGLWRVPNKRAKKDPRAPKRTMS